MWLPQGVVRETYEEYLYATTKTNEVAHVKTIFVDDLIAEAKPPDFFVLTAPDDVVVHDAVRGISFTNFTTARNPLPHSVVPLVAQVKPPWYADVKILLLLASALFVAIIACLRSWRLASIRGVKLTKP